MNKKFKFLTVLLALVMTLGAFAPFGAVKAADETTESVTLHKILQTKENLKNANFPGTKGLDGTEYIGKKIEETEKPGSQDKSSIASYFGAGSKDIGGVYFAWAKKDTDGKYYWIKSDGNFTTTKTEVKENELDKLPTDTFGGITVEDSGIEFTTNTFKGEYKIYEIHAKSSYKGNKGETLTDMKAVPVVITLPLVNNDGVVVNAHVYPKNTEEKPKIDKNFAKEHGLTYVIDPETGKNVGADYNNYEKQKGRATAEIGKEIKYEVKTFLPENAKYKTVIWNDSMTKGLTYNKNLVISGLKDADNKDFIKGTDYILEEDDRGFNLRFTDKGIEKLETALKKGSKDVYLHYSATVNSDCVVDNPEKNHIEFEYNNKQTEPTPEPPETNPTNKEIPVEKTWSDGQVPADVVVVYTLQEKEGTTWKDVKSVTVKGPNYNYTFKELDDNKTYRVKERVSGYTPEYKVENGKYGITNKKHDGPKPLEPTTPEVVNGGKRFVKTNQDGTQRLAGAEFYVKNTEGKYLVADQKDATKVTTARDLYINLIAAYNDAIEKTTGATVEEKEKSVTVKNPLFKNATETPNEKENLVGKTEISKKIDDLRLAYEKAFIENANAYKWEDAPAKGTTDNRVVLTSDAQGRFEITGLEYGSYKLEEKTPPKGYAKLSGDVDFEVKEGSYDGSDTELKYNIEVKQGEKVVYGKQVKNKKVSIPETGGIGTVIFTVVGVMLMVGAAFALKRRKEDELEGLA